MQTAILIAIASISYAAFALLIGQSGKGMNAYLSTAIFNTLGGVIPFAAYLFLRYIKKAPFAPSTPAGYLYAVLAGLAIAFFNILLLFIFARGGVAYAMPAVYGGTIVLSALAGWLLLGEPFSLLQGAGVSVVALGVGMVVASKL